MRVFQAVDYAKLFSTAPTKFVIDTISSRVYRTENDSTDSYSCAMKICIAQNFNAMFQIEKCPIKIRIPRYMKQKCILRKLLRWRVNLPSIAFFSK